MYTDRLARRHVTVVSEVPRVFQAFSRHGTLACTTRLSGKTSSFLNGAELSLNSMISANSVNLTLRHALGSM